MKKLFWIGSLMGSLFSVAVHASSFKIEMFTEYENRFGRVNISSLDSGQIQVKIIPSGCGYDKQGNERLCLTPQIVLPTYTVSVTKTDFGGDFEVPGYKFRIVTHSDSPKLLSLNNEGAVEAVHSLNYRYVLQN
ncbi:MAG: hypothetical protein JWQ35_2755 [Bacteriovoracaceae bacterium]|nr:hypothetical protein [Bacteriovoracaceae bacterium]